MRALYVYGPPFREAARAPPGTRHQASGPLVGDGDAKLVPVPPHPARRGWRREAGARPAAPHIGILHKKEKTCGKELHSSENPL